jgi:transposase-like protein
VRGSAVGAWAGAQAEGGEGKDGRGSVAQAKRGSMRRIQQRGTWTEESMKEAIKEVKKGTSSIGKIGEKYGIPESSIRDWLTGKTSSKKKGPRTVLSKEEEESMVDWCLDMQRNGHAITFYMLRRKVADICQGRETPFRNGVPGKSWMDWFRKRHPTVMIEAAHSLKGKKRTDTPRGRALLGKHASSTPCPPIMLFHW